MTSERNGTTRPSSGEVSKDLAAVDENMST